MSKMTFPAASRFAVILAFCCFAIASFPQEELHSISAEDADKLLLTRVAPTYPESVKGANVAGNIIVHFNIQKDGSTGQVQAFYADAATRKFALIAHPEVQKAVVDAIKQWKYRPYLINGEPTEVATMAILRFDFCKQDSSCQSEPAELKVVAVRGPGTPIAGNVLLSNEEVRAKIVKQVPPRYPQMAKVAHVSGDVVLHILIDKQGHVAQMKVKSGDPLLIQAAMDAVKQWEYQPFEVGGQIVQVESDVTVRFHM